MRIIPRNIMCAVDFSDFTEMTLSYGKSLALEFDSKLLVCHVVPGTVMVSSHMTPYIDYAGIEDEQVQHTRERLAKLVETLDIECELIVSAGHPADEIEQIARQNKVDMVIAATHGGSGVKRFLIGSVTNRLVKILPCPLLVLHARVNERISRETIVLKRILVGCDFSADSRLAFDYALSLAQEFEAQLYLVNVIRPEDHLELSASDYIEIQNGEIIDWSRPEYMDLQKKAIRENQHRRQARIKHIEQKLSDIVPEESRYFCTPVTVVLDGQPYQELITYAEEKQVDMIILGVRGHTLLEKFLVGSTTDRVISRAPCPVLAVRHID